MKNRLFEIATLSDCADCYDHVTLQDPVTIIGGTIGFLQTIFPNLLFGGRSAGQIAADEQASMEFHQAAFLREYGIQLADNIVIAVLRPGWDIGEDGSQLWNRIMVRFYNENREALEAAKSGLYNYVGGKAPGGIFTPFNLAATWPYIAGGVLLILLLKKKK